MYTKRPTMQAQTPIRLPEHYSGVAFAPKEAPKEPDTATEEAKMDEVCTEKTASVEETEQKPDTVEASAVPVSQKVHERHSLFGLSGHEDLLLLILAILLLDEEGGDDTLAYILLGLLFLS